MFSRTHGWLLYSLLATVLLCLLLVNLCLLFDHCDPLFYAASLNRSTLLRRRNSIMDRNVMQRSGNADESGASLAAAAPFFDAFLRRYGEQHRRLELTGFEPRQSARLVVFVVRSGVGAEMHGGLGDRLRAAASAFFYALATNASFYIDYRDPTYLHEYFTSNYFNWRFDTLDERVLRSLRQVESHDFYDSYCQHSHRPLCISCKQAIDSSRRGRCMFNSDASDGGVVHYVAGNADYRLLAHGNGPNASARRCFIRKHLNRMGLLNVRVRDSFGLLLRALLERRAPAVARAVATLLRVNDNNLAIAGDEYNLDASPNTNNRLNSRPPLVCIHLRTGNPSAWQDPNMGMFEPTNVVAVARRSFERVDDVLRNSIGEEVEVDYFVGSDNERVRLVARDVLRSERRRRLFVTPVAALHVDRVSGTDGGGGLSSQARRQLLYTMAEFVVFSDYCSMLFRSLPSGFSSLAADQRLRGVKHAIHIVDQNASLMSSSVDAADLVEWAEFYDTRGRQRATMVVDDGDGLFHWCNRKSTDEWWTVK